MAAIAYHVKRDVPAENGAGTDCKIAVIFVRHENGFVQTVCVNEEMLTFECGGDPDKERRLFEHEISRALR